MIGISTWHRHGRSRSSSSNADSGTDSEERSKKRPRITTTGDNTVATRKGQRCKDYDGMCGAYSYMMQLDVVFFYLFRKRFLHTRRELSIWSWQRPSCHQSIISSSSPASWTSTFAHARDKARYACVYRVVLREQQRITGDRISISVIIVLNVHVVTIIAWGSGKMVRYFGVIKWWLTVQVCMYLWLKSWSCVQMAKVWNHCRCPLVVRCFSAMKKSW